MSRETITYVGNVEYGASTTQMQGITQTRLLHRAHTFIAACKSMVNHVHKQFLPGKHADRLIQTHLTSHAQVRVENIHPLHCVCVNYSVMMRAHGSATYKCYLQVLPTSAR